MVVYANCMRLRDTVRIYTSLCRLVGRVLMVNIPSDYFTCPFKQKLSVIVLRIPPKLHHRWECHILDKRSRLYLSTYKSSSASSTSSP